MSGVGKREPGKTRRHATLAAAKVPAMVRELMAAPQRAKEEGKKVAYSFINSAYDEIIRAMDIVPAWTENFAGVCGAKRVATLFLERAEQEYFSRSLCTYALCGLGFDVRRDELGEMPPEAPWGGIARPDMLLGTGGMICDPRYKWFEALKAYLPGVPVYVTNIHWPPYEADIDYREVQDYYVSFVVTELRGLVAFLERETGRKMDWERLSEVVDLSDRTWNLIWEGYELRRAVPTPMGTGDAFNTMVPSVFLMGTREAHDFYRDLYQELESRVANKLGAVPEEKYRLLWGGGLAAWFALADFDYFAAKGAAFPAEVSYRLVEPIYRLDLPPVSDPIERIAWRWVKYWTYWYQSARQRPGSHPDVERLIQFIEDYQIDGVLMHEAFSCRSWHPGLIWQLNTLKKVYRDIPSLVLESDMVDISSYSEADTHSRIDAFMETVALAKSRRG